LARTPANEFRIIPSSGAAIPLQWRKPFAINLQRGPDPATFELHFTDPVLDKVKNPVSLEIKTSTAQNRSATLKLAKWYVIGRRVTAVGDYVYTLADVRWKGRYEKLTKPEGYNVRVAGGSYRPESLDDGNPWTVIKAVTDALERLGYEVDEKLSTVDKAVLLPDTIGTTKGGGWFAAPQTLFIPAMLETVRGDITITTEGKVAIVDRRKTQKVDFARYGAIAGVSGLGKRMLKWAIPKEIKVLFQRRNEGRIEYQEGGTVADNPREIRVRNVLPDVDLTAPTAPVSDWANLLQYARARLGLSASSIQQKFMAPRLSGGSGDPGDTARSIGQKALAESLVREHWRRTFQMSDNEALKGHADIQLGRLLADGSTSTAGVAMNYVKRLRYGAKDDEQAPAFEARFTANVAFTNPAPFVAQWLDRPQRVFTLSYDQSDFETLKVWPGAFDQPASFNRKQLRKMLQGSPIQPETNCQFTDNYRLQVYWHGLQVQEIGAADPRYIHTYKVSGLSEQPEGPTLYVEAEDMTANYGYSVLGNLSGELLNESELRERGEFVGEQIAETYRQQRSGVVRFPGIEPLAKNAVRVGGEILGITIQVGQQALYDIYTTAVYQPEVLPARVKPVKAVPSVEIL